MSFDGANIQQFPDIPAVSAEILALRGWEGEKRRAAVRLPWLSECRPPWAHYLTGGLSPCDIYPAAAVAAKTDECVNRLKSEDGTN